MFARAAMAPLPRPQSSSSFGQLSTAKCRAAESVAGQDWGWYWDGMGWNGIGRDRTGGDRTGETAAETQRISSAA